MSIIRDFFNIPTRDKEDWRCEVHGQITHTIRLKNMGELDGDYCGKCLAEFYARTLKRAVRFDIPKPEPARRPRR